MFQTDENENSAVQPEVSAVTYTDAQPTTTLVEYATLTTPAWHEVSLLKLVVFSMKAGLAAIPALLILISSYAMFMILVHGLSLLFLMG